MHRLLQCATRAGWKALAAEAVIKDKGTTGGVMLLVRDWIVLSRPSFCPTTLVAGDLSLA